MRSSIVAKDTDAPDLRFASDKKAWGDHLPEQIEIENIRNRNRQVVGNCCGGFQSFRGGALVASDRGS